MRQKWQSSSALTASSSKQHQQQQPQQQEPLTPLSFGRLKKSYATMRKSFRLQMAGSDHARFDFDSSDNDQDESTNKRNLIGQIGFGAAKLLRGVYSKGRMRTNNPLECDSIQSTNGSFKILSTMANYGELALAGQSNTQNHQQQQQQVNGKGTTTISEEPIALGLTHAAKMTRKSELEMEIEQRLLRSKGRVLPSASYQAPDSEKACDGLNMDELEEIKRDNLRLTLRSQKIVVAEEQEQKKKHVADAMSMTEVLLNSVELGAEKNIPDSYDDGREGDRTICSCRRIASCDLSTNKVVASSVEHSDLGEDLGQHNYCSCASISSSCESISELLDTTQTTTTTKINVDLNNNECGPVESLSPRSMSIGRSCRLKSLKEKLHELPPTVAVGQVSAVVEAGAMTALTVAAAETTTTTTTVTSDQGQQELRKQGEHVVALSTPSKDDSGAGGTTQQVNSKREYERQQQQSRASDDLVGEKIEEKLGKMFDSLGEFSFGRDNSCEFENVCGVRESTDCSCYYHQEVKTKLRNKQDIINFYQEREHDKGSALRELEQQQQQQQVDVVTAVSDKEKNEERAVRNCCSLGGVSLLSAQQQNQRQGQQVSHCHCGSMQTRRECEQLTHSATATATATINTTTVAQTSLARDDAIELDTNQQQFACSKSSSSNNNNDDRQHATKTDHHQPVQQGRPTRSKQRRHRTLTDGIHPLKDSIEDPSEHNQVAIEVLKAFILESDCKSLTREESLRLIKREKKEESEAAMMMKEETPDMREDEVWRFNQFRQKQAGCTLNQLNDGRYLLMEPSGSNNVGSNEEHLYASICGSHTSSPERAGRLHEQPHKLKPDEDEQGGGHYENPYQQQESWQVRKFNGQLDHDEKQRRLFDIQLNSQHPFPESYQHHRHVYELELEEQLLSRHQQQVYQQAQATSGKNKQKRSLFSRLRHLITPTVNNKHSGKGFSSAPVDGGHHQQTLKNDWPPFDATCPSSSSASRWQKSATLTSKSTQNLFGNSLRQYLSTSRKSINLVGTKSGVDLDDEDRELAVRKSFVSGFLTLGRRSQADAVATKHELLSQIFKDHHEKVNGMEKVATCDRRIKPQFGSADSLPSADSGLSCSNLQNSSSCDENYPANLRGLNNVYTRIPPHEELLYNKNDNKHLETVTTRRPIVGRARAKVDCNPCAYDKEALVFKRGDIIDILERNQSGTWIGQCGKQVGHFKFINVTEISNPSEDHGQDASENGNSLEEKLTSGGKTFVTKLEIRSNNNNNEQPLQRRPEEEELTSANTTLNRRSISMNTISHQKKQYEVDSSSKLNESNETIMSSLEQLLFAIGLAGEQVANNRRKQQHKIKDSVNVPVKCSYLNMLSEGGINNLDSFSAIDDWHELEQIGIVDDEHRRRLLMAARIIRQASQAAKLDFVENYRIKRSTTADDCATPTTIVRSANSDSCEPASEKVIAICSGKASSRLQQTTCQQQTATTRGAPASKHLNEPIYVNLVDMRSKVGAAPIVQNQERVRNLDSKATNNVGHERQTLTSQQVRKREHLRQSKEHHWQEQDNMYQAARSNRIDSNGSRTREIVLNSINQPDHYHPRSTQQPSLDISCSVIECDSYDRHSRHRHHHQKQQIMQKSERNADEDNHYNDEQEPSFKLTRGYSVKMINNNKANQNNARHSTFEGFGKLHDDLIRCGGDRELAEERLRQQNETMNLRSQVNSKSAYDLRLDLSHFFS